MGSTPNWGMSEARSRVAAELVSDLERVYSWKKAADKEPRGAHHSDRHLPAELERHRSVGRGC
jgi:hypothetical protein